MAFGPEYSSSGSQSTGWEAQQNEDLLDGTNPAEGDCAMTKSISRRRLLAVLSGGVVGAAGLSAGKASAAASQHTLWRLNPDWGTPLTTPSGSATKTRCSGSACHLAAPHRFFLSQADALAGRLHSCCLAQPVPVTLCIDLNELMPFYRARRSGCVRHPTRRGRHPGSHTHLAGGLAHLADRGAGSHDQQRRRRHFRHLAHAPPYRFQHHRHGRHRSCVGGCRGGCIRSREPSHRVATSRATGPTQKFVP